MFGLSSEERRLFDKVLGHLKTFLEKENLDRSVLSDEIVALKKQIVELEIQTSKKQESFDKQERELRHMIGLEKKRQEFEIEQAKRETTVLLREENLKADRDRFDSQLKFHDERFEKEVGYLKGILGDILKRLPDISLTLEK